MIRARTRDLAATISRSDAVEAALTRLESSMRKDRSLAVLTYHRIDRAEHRPWLYPGLISATPEAFESQVDWLSRRFEVISIDDVLAARNGRRLPRRAILLTFDDGYADFAEHAWPILRSARLPATLFMATGAAETEAVDFWWDRLHDAIRRGARGRFEWPAGELHLDGKASGHVAYRSAIARLKLLPHATVLGIVARVEQSIPRGEPHEEPGPVAGSTRSMLDWETLRRMEQEGLSIAPHTRTHPILTRVSPQVARDEIEGSRADLAAHLNGPHLAVFAYPSGDHDDPTVATVAELDIALAFTTDPGLNRPGADCLRLRRFNVGGRSSPGLLAARLLAARLRPSRTRMEPNGCF